MHGLILLFSVFFNILQGSTMIFYVICSFLFTHEPPIKLVSTAKQLVDDLLSFITDELNSNLKNKSELTLCQLIQIG